jgi:carbohydrate binding protein with CBM11 domain/PHP domain-containing protein
VVLLAGAYALWVALWRPLPITGPDPTDGFTRIAGVVHVHTTASDGTGSPEEVAATAEALGLGFLAITDHNNLDAKEVEGYHGTTLVMVGLEASTQSGHLLALGIPDPVFRFSGDAPDALDDVRLLGGAAFAAHPMSAREDFLWTGWDLPGPWGIELLNGDSQWREAGWWRLAQSAALYGLNPRYALLRSLTRPRSVLGRWDALLAARDVPGIAGADAHARLPVSKSITLRFPSYASMFALVQNHVLLEAPLAGEAQQDGPAIVGALARGRSYVAVDALAPANGFSFVAEAGAERWTMGDTVAPRPGLRLRAGGRVPKGALFTVLRDGRELRRGAGGVELDPASPGVYRVEVRLPGWDVPWILSNPIYVFPSEAAGARRQRAAWPSEPSAPAFTNVVDTFDGFTVFAPAADSYSSLQAPILDPHGGADGKGAARLAFRLGVPDAGHRDVFCAIENRQDRDLTGHSGLVFAIKGDGVYRIWVQVRDDNPASADDGMEFWFASVRSSTEWRRVAIPFTRLRSINKKTDGRLDLDKVRGIVFVLDRGAEKPGTQGTIWIDDVGVY